MKGNIVSGNKVFKLVDKSLLENAKKTYQQDYFKKIELDCSIEIKEEKPIILNVQGTNNLSHISVAASSDIIPVSAINSPITADRIKNQLRKTGNTPFEFRNIEIDLDDNLYISPISALNELRRTALSLIQEKIVDQYSRAPITYPNLNFTKVTENSSKPNISVLFNTLDDNKDYSSLSGIDRVYIPLKYFIGSLHTKHTKILEKICSTFPTYLYLPVIMKDPFKNILLSTIEKAISLYSIKGFVVSNISQLSILDKWNTFSIIANCSMNIFNNQTCDMFSSFESVTLSPELNKQDLSNISCPAGVKKEIMVYGRTPLMYSNYCLLGKTNKCYPKCEQKCKDPHTYYLKDRLNMLFPIVPDPIQTITTIYNSKITSISPLSLNADSVRIDFLEEDLLQMQEVIDCIRNDKRLEGKDFTNGNLNREI